MSLTAKKTEPTYVSELNCIYCESKFSVRKVRTSFANVVKRDGDFCCHYKDINPYYYEIFICPSCNFAFNDKFKPIIQHKRKAVDELYTKQIKNTFISSERNHLDALKSFKLALYCAMISGQSSFVIGSICLRLAWLNRYKGNTNEEERFLKNALEHFEKTYNSENLERQNINRDMLLYLIAELNARLGHYQEARKWFSIIIQDRSIKPNIMKMARERWLDYKYDACGQID